jgi:acyl dehydratase
VIYFEDMIVGQYMTSPAVVVDRDEMVDFAKRWDPLPIHVDSEVAASRGGPTAPGLFILAVKQRLIHQLPEHAVIASFGYDEVRFHHPLRPGDEVHLRYEFVEARPSSSKPDRGIVTIRLSLVRNDDDEVVMSHLDTILVRRRVPLDRAPRRGTTGTR